jgi:transcription-repair coupling factor (superfamily II helicase)
MKQQQLPPIPSQANSKASWAYPIACSPSIILSSIIQTTAASVLIITADNAQARTLTKELSFFAADYSPCYFPSQETLPYDRLSPHADLSSERLKILKHAQQQAPKVLITAVSTLMQRLPPTKFLALSSITIAKNDKINLSVLRQQLLAAGYYEVNEVREHGEFASRGAILDLFPMGAQLPFRLDFFDDEIDSIRTFSPDSQLSCATIEYVDLLPAREVPFDSQAIKYFRDTFSQRFPGSPLSCPLYQDVSSGISPPGIEYYLPLFCQHTASLYDYLPANLLLVSIGEINKSVNTFWQEIEQRYNDHQYDRYQPILAPEELFFTPTDLLLRSTNYAHLELIAQDTAATALLATAPSLGLDKQQPLSDTTAKQLLATLPGRVLFTSSSLGRRELLLPLLQRLDITPQFCASWPDFLASTNRYSIAIAPLSYGCSLQQTAITIFSEHEFFTKALSEPQDDNNSTQEALAPLLNLSDLTNGDPVVHYNYGVGRYQGLVSLKTGNYVGDFLCLEYAGGDKLYVPIASLALVSPYTGADYSQAPWHSLNNDQWRKAQRKAKAQINDVAAELLNIYSKRALQVKTPLLTLNEDYHKFAANFPFTETRDQQQAINAVLADMLAHKPMDRVICGDVGFGKTEIAMRAAFVAIQNNCQVAILVPTTLLAQQHYQTFQERFAAWPICIGMISRLVSAKQQQQLLQQVTNGSLDILIGTHKILQRQLAFKQLGLLVIDEEHLFGVKQKERLKELRANIDILTLTATPIPRTLHMSLAGIRDLSIIATPPARRLAIKTLIHEYATTVIQEAVQRELLRGGQVFFVHNEVTSINKVAKELETILPGARIAVAHGQMRDSLLELVMSDFYQRRYTILVCTTIIESGIDIPNANTIIINNADRFGMAQLHQLRGRVGRSHHQAYAYLLINCRKSLNDAAAQRLEALTALETLGSGFTLATHDLEIRGAGTLLGAEQSGNIQEIGFGLYNDLLARTINDLKDGKTTTTIKEPLDISIDLQLSAIIPADYLADVALRLQFYKRIASATNVSSLDQLQVEMIDRFGLLPSPLKNLFGVQELKLLMQQLGAIKLIANANNASLEFSQDTPVAAEHLIHLIKTQPQQYRLTTASKLQLTLVEHDTKDRIALIHALLQQLLPS